MEKVGYTLVGYGFAEEEARKDCFFNKKSGYNLPKCISVFEKQYKAICIKKPVIPNRANVKKVKTLPKSWKTRYVAYEVNREGVRIETKKGIILKTKSPGQAVDEVRKMVIKNRTAYVIKVEKHLLSGNEDIALICPNKIEVGAWLFVLSK